jgi:hypothetical protein
VRRHLAGVLLAVVVSVGGLSAVLAQSVASPAVAEAQTPTSVDVSACVPGATIPADRPANGPSPVGHCDPTEGQRVLDTAVWLWVVGLLVVLAVIGVVVFGRSFRRSAVDAG